MNRGRWLLACVGAVVVLGVAAALFASHVANTRVVSSPLVGKTVPDIAGQTIDGQSAALSEYRGRWVLVNFFATWCVPCRDEHAELVTFDERHRAIGDAAVFAVVYSDSAGAAREFRDGHGGDWPILDDPSGRIADDMAVGGVPQSFLISPEGIVARKIAGGVRAADLEELLAQAKTSPL